MATFADMTGSGTPWAAPGNTPARAYVEAKLASPHWKVEIAIIAAQ